MFIKCSNCGEPITGSWSRGRNKKYPYYHCPARCRGVNIRKEKLEQKFAEVLERMQVRPEKVALFRKIVLDQWEEKQDCTVNLLADCQRQTKKLDEQKQKLMEAFVYQKAIDQETYERERDKLEEDITLAKMRLKDAQLDEVDVEAVLNFAGTFLLNTARLWLEMSLEQRQRFQKVLFPQGIELMPDGAIRTAVTCSVFEMLHTETTPHTRMAALVISNWNRIAEFLQQMTVFLPAPA
jgi:site-specific DNA recombinase